MQELYIVRPETIHPTLICRGGGSKMLVTYVLKWTGFCHGCGTISGKLLKCPTCSGAQFCSKSCSSRHSCMGLAIEYFVENRSLDPGVIVCHGCRAVPATRVCGVECALPLCSDECATRVMMDKGHAAICGDPRRLLYELSLFRARQSNKKKKKKKKKKSKKGDQGECFICLLEFSDIHPALQSFCTNSHQDRLHASCWESYKASCSEKILCPLCGQISLM